MHRPCPAQRGSAPEAERGDGTCSQHQAVIYGISSALVFQRCSAWGIKIT